MLNREPMGMKPNARGRWYERGYVSVLNREPMGMKLCNGEASVVAAQHWFQCSTASRWG